MIDSVTAQKMGRLNFEPRDIETPLYEKQSLPNRGLFFKLKF